MKKLLFLAIFFLTLHGFAQENSFNWLEDLKPAMQASKSQNKPILLFFMDSNSKESLAMNKQLFESPEFKRIAEQVVLVKADKSGDNPLSKRLIGHYNKQGQFSSFVTLDYYGRVQGESVSNFDAASLETYYNFLNNL